MTKTEINDIVKERIQAKFPDVQEQSLEILLAIVREELLKETSLHGQNCYCSICTLTSTA